METRRRILLKFLVWGLPIGIFSHRLAAQVRPTPLPRSPVQKEDDIDLPKPDPKAVLEAHRKDIKKNVERLYQLASELKAEVEKTNSVQVLSVAMLKKTEEIEKLAKEIRSRAIG
jgi:hypothetical protein